MSEAREDNYLEKRAHLAGLSNDELKERFWSLTEQIVDPLLDFAHTYTSPSIERSVLLRMGFSSVEATKIVNNVMDRGLMGKGAGHIVYRLSKEKGISVREAGLKLYNDEMWEDVVAMFKGGNK
ncbi:ornithine aminomutase subunit alpha [Bacillus tuaregi]|uniref:ornithine aminomutase subunit alpha n=1 Tax=Bacillus tuaregi TaxID=1816695 RepID=UPI0008F967CC|nr:ornithine aminomutase subunit alpha [Bacillus tuaregi]